MLRWFDSITPDKSPNEGKDRSPCAEKCYTFKVRQTMVWRKVPNTVGLIEKSVESVFCEINTMGKGIDANGVGAG